MYTEEIVVLERPEEITWEEISTVLKNAHSDNVSKGIILPYPALPPKELCKKTEGRGGKMIVALHKGKVVGTGAVAVIEKDLWCGKGKYAYCFLDAVLPEYMGQGIYRRIENWQENYARTVGVDRMLFDTHEDNKRMLHISEKNGYRRVEYRIKENRNSVVMVKWLNGCPYSRLKCAVTYYKIIRYRRKNHKQNIVET